MGGKFSRFGEQHSTLNLPFSSTRFSGNPLYVPLDTIKAETTGPKGDLGRGGHVSASVSLGLGISVGHASVGSVEQIPSETEVALFSSVQDLRRSVGLRELERGDCNLISVLDSLVLALHELFEPKPLTTFKGKSFISHVFSVVNSFNPIGPREEQPISSAKVFAWSRGLGCEISPIKTHSAQKQAEVSVKESVILSSTDSDHGALKGIKSLASLNHDLVVHKY
jgi:hypothetical protein